MFKMLTGKNISRIYKGAKINIPQIEQVQIRNFKMDQGLSFSYLLLLNKLPQI